MTRDEVLSIMPSWRRAVRDGETFGTFRSPEQVLAQVDHMAQFPTQAMEQALEMHKRGELFVSRPRYEGGRIVMHEVCPDCGWRIVDSACPHCAEFPPAAASPREQTQ